MRRPERRRTISRRVNVRREVERGRPYGGSVSSSGDDVADDEVRGGFLVEGGGEVSAAPFGWRERRFIVDMWIDVGISY